MSFKIFAQAIEENTNFLINSGEVFVVDVDKEILWDFYLDSFPEGTNEIYKERREYDCQCCRQFIRNVGALVGIKDGKLVSIWDVEAEGYYSVVAKKMSEFVRSKTIKTRFMHSESRFGNRVTHQHTDDGVIDWNHYFCQLPSRLVSSEYRSVLSGINATKQVYQRGLQEITSESLEIVLDFILQGAIYRGEEFKDSVTGFQKLKKQYDDLSTEQDRSIFVWATLGSGPARIRNTAIGTLLQDLSEGKGINSAVASFESKVAPSNYKRTSAPVTEGMVKKAVSTIKELGLESALQRRYAKLSDVSVNNVLFVDRNISPLMKDSLENVLMGGVTSKKQDYSKVEEIGVEDFINNVLPNINAMELLVGGKHKSNLMSLTAPANPDCDNMLKWNNNFAWSYNGDITDSIKERVKSAGGSVTGDLRVSLAWNNSDDLDIQVVEPNGQMISYRNTNSRESGGKLDVDMNVNTSGRNFSATGPVENITWDNFGRIPEGTYHVRVNNYTSRNSTNLGLTVEVECKGEVTTFTYPLKIRNGETVQVVNVKVKNGGVTFHNVNKKATAEGVSQDIWGVQTEKFQRVNSVMFSPNFWDDQTIGNKHYMFMLDGCENPEETRGIYNEFLLPELTPHRKVFEMLSDRMKCPIATDQLSGLGFSSTQRNEVICKVSGSFNRTLKIKF